MGNGVGGIDRADAGRDKPIRAVVYGYPFVPPEWIAAHGLVPHRVVPQGDEDTTFSSTAGACPYVGAFAAAAGRVPDAVAVVLTTSCDQMRRAGEQLADRTGLPVFILHVPRTSGIPSARQVYTDELLRLGRFLERLNGVCPSTEILAATIGRFDDARNRLRAMRQAMAPRRFSAALMRFQQGDWNVLEEPEAAGRESRGIPVALVGGPLTLADMDLFDAIEQAGGHVVLDATTTGERTLPRPFDPARTERAPLEELVDAYFADIPDPCHRPNDAMYEWLDAMIRDRAARGVLFRRYVWCDTWHVETERLRERSPVPVLVLDAEERWNRTRAENRIQAFLEMLR